MMTPLKRRTLGTYGRRGDRVRVLVDVGRARVEVLYRDAQGISRKRVFPDDKAGRAEALAWAETFHQERERLATLKESPAPITVRQLWQAFTQAPAFHELRPDTRPNYADRWRLWVRFTGEDAVAGDTRLLDVDRFIVRMQAIPTTQGNPRSINQIRQVLNVVRTVYNWGQARELLARNELARYRWRRRKDAEVLAPDEYTSDEYAAILGALSPQHATRWRGNVAVLLAGASGQRANAIEHLRWQDVDLRAGVITWPARYQKQGVPLVRPITPDIRAALWTAWQWREAGTTRRPKRLGSLASPARLALADWVLFADHDASQPVSYQSLHKMLREAEDAAGVAHKPYRGLHGFRRMVVGDVGEITGDLMLGLELVGDTDPKMLKSYNKRAAARIAKASEALASKTFPNRSSEPDATSAPAGTGAPNTKETNDL